MDLKINLIGSKESHIVMLCVDDSLLKIQNNEGTIIIIIFMHKYTYI